MRQPPATPVQRGYSLLETLVALAIFLMALLVAGNAITAQAGLARRLQTRQDLLHTAETVLESVRGGVLPLEGGRVELGSEFGRSSTTGVYSSVIVDQLEPDGLYQVEVRTWTRLEGRRVAVELRSLVWRP